MLEVNEYFANNNKNSIFPSIHDAALYCDQQVIEKVYKYINTFCCAMFNILLL